MTLCPSVRLSQTGVLSKLTDGSSWLSAQRLPSNFRILRYKKIPVSLKIRVIPSGTLSQTLDLEKKSKQRIEHRKFYRLSSTDDRRHFFHTECPIFKLTARKYTQIPTANEI